MLRLIAVCLFCSAWTTPLIFAQESTGPLPTPSFSPYHAPWKTEELRQRMETAYQDQNLGALESLVYWVAADSARKELMQRQLEMGVARVLDRVVYKESYSDSWNGFTSAEGVTYRYNLRPVGVMTITFDLDPASRSSRKINLN